MTVTALPAAVRGTVAMAATLDDGNGAGVTSVRYQVRPASTGVWTDFCTANAAPVHLLRPRPARSPDGVIDVRAIATDGAALATTSATVASRIDNTIPSAASLTAPATNLSGTVTLNATAADAGSGIASVRVPARAGRHVDLDHDLHRHVVLVLVRVEHHDRDRRALRPARHRDRRRRRNAHVDDGHEPPRRQHRPDRCR